MQLTPIKSPFTCVAKTGVLMDEIPGSHKKEHFTNVLVCFFSKHASSCTSKIVIQTLMTRFNWGSKRPQFKAQIIPHKNKNRSG